jgi:hypothetical protein
MNINKIAIIMYFPAGFQGHAGKDISLSRDEYPALYKLIMML